MLPASGTVHAGDHLDLAVEGALFSGFGTAGQRCTSLGTVIENNIFFRNAVTLGGGDCQGIDFATAGDKHIIRNNLFFGPERTAIQGNSGDYTGTANLEDKDPLFANAERGDFHLREGSPAIDSASAQSAVSADIEDIPRPQGKARDIGAFEDRNKER